jgi:hypothetical protein
VVAALRSGACYASTGPRFDTIEPVPGGLLVRCSPCRAVTLCSGPEDGGRAMVGRLAFRHRARILDRDPSSGLITAVEFAPPPGADAARIELVDGDGGTAWSNPVGL